jgi:hypothetical protein
VGEGDTLLHEVAGDHWAMGVEQQRWAKATQGDGRTTFLNSSEPMCVLGWASHAPPFRGGQCGEGDAFSLSLTAIEQSNRRAGKGKNLAFAPAFYLTCFFMAHLCLAFFSRRGQSLFERAI